MVEMLEVHNNRLSDLQESSIVVIVMIRISVNSWWKHRCAFECKDKKNYLENLKKESLLRSFRAEFFNKRIL